MLKIGSSPNLPFTVKNPLESAYGFGFARNPDAFCKNFDGYCQVFVEDLMEIACFSIQLRATLRLAQK